MKRTIAVVFAVTTVSLASTASAPAHRNACHRQHTCPSDHATYRWHGKLCVKPGAREQTSAFRHKVRYGGLSYYCK